MGGTKTVVKRDIMYIPDPKLQREIDGMKIELAEMEKRYTDPNKFAEIENELFEKFVSKVNTCKFEKVTVRRTTLGEKHVAFMGPISVGKSYDEDFSFFNVSPKYRYLINVLLGDKKCKTGRGETTMELVRVGNVTNVVFWDLPGNNKHYNYLEIDKLGFLVAMDTSFVLFSTSPKDIERIVRVAVALNANVVCVRTQLDKGDEDDEDALDWNQTLKNDAAELKDMTGKEIKVFGISAKNVKINGEKREDNETFQWKDFLLEVMKKN